MDLGFQKQLTDILNILAEKHSLPMNRSKGTFPWQTM
jgi:hypothetical protein